MTSDSDSAARLLVPPIPAYGMPDDALLQLNRVSWLLERERAALLVHDMQNYWIDRFQDSGPLLRNCASVLDVARQARMPVFYSVAGREQRPEDRGLALDMWGVGLGGGREDPYDDAIVDALAPRDGDGWIEKRKYSAFFETTFEAQLRTLGISQLIISGVYAHHGCLLTAADAFMRDIQVFFVIDAVADHSEEEHLMTARLVPTTCGQIVTTDWLRKALRA